MATKKKDQITTAPAAPDQGPMFFREILGQDRVLSHLKTALKQERLSHAYLFLGPEGVGKASTARALAAALNCTQPHPEGDACGACPSCRRLAAGTHPDFLVIAPPPDKTQIAIEQIRELSRLTNYAPLGGGWRVVLVKPAEALTAISNAAAHALLKTLEEPPPRHVLVLTARGEADLLPTVISRCHKLSFAPLPATLIAGELERRRNLTPAQAKLAAALSGGSLGRALTVDPGELAEQRRQVLAELARLTQGPVTAVLDWALRLSKRQPELDQFLLMAQLWYRDLLLAHYQAPAHLLAHQDLLVELAQAQAGGGPETWFAKFTALGAAQRQLQANLNPELTLNVLGLRLQGRGHVHDSR
jgi:DNA polymerase-3 subunit delta'